MLIFQMWSPFRQMMVARHTFYVDQARKRLLSQFDDMEVEADKAAEEWLTGNQHRFDPDRDDPADYYERAHDESIQFYTMLSDMREQVQLGLVAGMYHEWDKQMREWIVNEMNHWHGGEIANQKIWAVNFETLIGVLSLADKWNSVLMWSHYANEHRGLCLEFETADHKCVDLQEVDYDSSRVIDLSEIYRWKVTSKSDAAALIKQKVIFTKADMWKYEGEWRATATPPGAYSAPLMLKAVYFGARCDSSIVTTIVKLFAGSEIALDFWQLVMDNAAGQLHRYPVDTEYLDAFGVRKSSMFAEDDFTAKFADLATLDEAPPDDE